MQIRVCLRKCENSAFFGENMKSSRKLKLSKVIPWSANIDNFWIKVGGKKEVIFHNFGPGQKLFWALSNFHYFKQFFRTRKFRQIWFENSEVAVPETLFSEVDITSNNCRIEMKSTWLERRNSVVLLQTPVVLVWFQFLAF